ncbi:MAG: aminotransferase class I/II-fold pyridoxal phosphate-dependent enzyme [Clostridiales Family XIII bacterium]|jgi:O-acetylhomoserine (thiol)-lyase|nr:aminotransferase class I/II-fold pyridoxal phosphate-dependent enzyme [Clostridiales Family XIII bacterium]
MTQYHFDTLRIKAGYRPEDHNNAVSVPIYQTASYTLVDSYRADRLFAFEDEDPIYTRLSNPTVDVLERRVAELHGASGAIALASGMAAVTYALLNAAAPGGRILTTARLYGGTVDSFDQVFADFGIEADIVEDADDVAEIERRITPDTKAIFIETLTNPYSTIADIEAIADVAHRHGILFICDNTVATPYLLNPLAHGADIVVYSATKALSGHGNVIAGIIVESGRFDYSNGHYTHFEKPLWFLRDKDDTKRNILQIFPDIPFTGRIRAIHLNYLGAALSPFDAYLILLGIETLSERVEKQVHNARKVRAFLEQSADVSWVRHPETEGSKYRALAEKYFPKGAGGLVSFGFKGTEEEMRTLLASTEVFSYQANIGDVRSLIINPAQTTHVELTYEMRERAGLTPDTIRLSLGLEDADDLIADLQQAFAKARGR